MVDRSRPELITNRDDMLITQAVHPVDVAYRAEREQAHQDLKEALERLITAHVAHECGIENPSVSQEEQVQGKEALDQEKDRLRRTFNKCDDLAVDESVDMQWASYVAGKREGFRAGIRHLVPTLALLNDDKVADDLIYSITNQDPVPSDT